MSRSLYSAGVALCALGSCEPAAVLFGKADAMTERWGPDWTLEMLAATDAALLEALGEQQVATLAARGAALDITDAVAYLHAEADRALPRHNTRPERSPKAEQILRSVVNDPPTKEPPEHAISAARRSAETRRIRQSVSATDRGRVTARPADQPTLSHWPQPVELKP